MAHKSSFFRSTLGSFSAACGIKSASLFKMSHIIGSYASFFSASSIALPLVGKWVSMHTLFMTCSFSFALRLLFGASALPMLAYWIPGLCAALYWKLPSTFYRAGLPLLSMILFCTHPVGAAASMYSLYWLIPLTIAFMHTKNIWLHALASTFTAHAVGSVIWLYTVPMTSAAWLALIPLVACERLLYASGIVVCDAIIAVCVSRQRSAFFKKDVALRNA